MKAYTEYELKQMENDDPKKHFYYSHEMQFRSLGINLESDDWELPLVHDETQAPKEDKFECFYEMMHSEKGVTLVDLKGNLVRLKQPDFQPEVISERLGREPKLDVKEPGPAPEGLGFTFYLLRVVTLGIYGGKKYSDYKKAVTDHEKAVSDYEKAKASYEEKKRPYDERKQKFDEHYKNLESMNKNVEKVKAYTISDKGAFEIEKTQAEQFSSSVNAVASVNMYRQNAHDRLEVLMGPKREANKERDEAVKAKIVEYNYLDKGAFSENPEKGSEKNKVIDVEIPENTGFTDHEIAVLGFAATCDPDIWAKAKSFPVPGGPRVMSDEEAKEKALVDAPSWYNCTEGLFARFIRNATEMTPTLNHSKIAVADALKSYKEGDCTALGKILKEGISCCTKHSMLVQDPKDDSRFVDYCLYVKEMLKMMDKDPKLAEAVKNAGLTEQDINEAKICSNFGEVFEKGVNAKDALLNNHDLTPDEKKSAAADVIGMRLVEKMCNDHFEEFTSAPEYADKINENIELARQKFKEANKIPLEERNGEKGEKYKTLMAEGNRANLATSHLILGYVSEKFGLKQNFGDKLTAVFGKDNSPKEVHDAIEKNVDLDAFKNMSGDRILYELTPSKTQKFLTELAPKEDIMIKKVAVKANVIEKQAPSEEKVIKKVAVKAKVIDKQAGKQM